jgi:hypothetical protein
MERSNIMKKLLFAIALALGCMINTANAQPLTMDEALDAVCRVNTNSARGSGTVFQEDEENYYVLTNGHVIERARKGHLEFFQDGYKSAMIPFKTEYVAYEEGTALDLAVVSVKKKYFGRYPPRVIPLAPKGTKIGANDLVMAGGCPSAQWATAWKGRVLNNTGAVVSFNAAPIGGQSGSGVLILIKDGEGVIHTRLGVLLAWRVGDGAWTDDGPNDYGAGLSLKQIYDIMEGNGRGYPIETSYGLVGEKKETKNTKSAEERLGKVCPHCGHKIKDHVVIPYEGGLRKTVRGEFMFCPELKLSDGSIEDTAKYYGGIKVGELYEGNGLFPWCPWDNRPPNQPPQLPPSNPNPPDNGGGFNGWPGRPNPDGGPTEPPLDFAKERQEYLDKITELKEKLTNLEGLSESLKAELSGINGNLSGANNEINGLKDMLGAVEGQKLTLKSRIDELLSFASDKDRVIDELKEEGAHYLDGPTGGNGNTVENVSFTLGGMSLGMLALKYGVPLLLNRRRRKKKKDEDNEDLDREEGYDNMGPSHPPSLDDGPKEHVHRHEHIHKHKHANEYIMPPDECPQPQTSNEIDDSQRGQSGPNSGFAGYGMPVNVATPYYQQPQPVHGLPPQFINIPFSTRKTVTSEQIMTVIGELTNEYRNDQTMTMGQLDTLIRQRLKEKFNIE